jgi:DNA integrity scanning protein DisA with diadenylate cyclase activity
LENKIIWDYDFKEYENLIKTITNTVPQFFGVIQENSKILEDTIEKKRTFELITTNKTFIMFYAKSLEMIPLINFIQDKISVWEKLLNNNGILLSKTIQFDILDFWLKSITKDNNTKWDSIIEKIEDLCIHTNENKITVFNIVVKKTKNDKVKNLNSISLSNFIKKYNKLSHSTNTYFSVNTNLDIYSYDNLSEINHDPEKVRTCLPAEIEPYIKINKKGDVYLSVHILNTGEIIIANAYGIVASKRDNHWHIFILSALKNFYSDRFTALYDKSASVLGQQLLHLAMKISYRRKGALLIFENENTLSINNVYAKVFNLNRQKELDLITENLFKYEDNKIKTIGNIDNFITIAEQDGAVICDNKKMIASNTFLNANLDLNIHELQGARELAAISAFKYNEKNIIVIKISEDGKIKIYFTYHDVPMYMSIL